MRKHGVDILYLYLDFLIKKYALIFSESNQKCLFYRAWI